MSSAAAAASTGDGESRRVGNARVGVGSARDRTPGTPGRSDGGDGSNVKLGLVPVVVVASAFGGALFAEGSRASFETHVAAPVAAGSGTGATVEVVALGSLADAAPGVGGGGVAVAVARAESETGTTLDAGAGAQLGDLASGAELVDALVEDAISLSLAIFAVGGCGTAATESAVDVERCYGRLSGSFCGRAAVGKLSAATIVVGRSGGNTSSGKSNTSLQTTSSSDASGGGHEASPITTVEITATLGRDGSENNAVTAARGADFIGDDRHVISANGRNGNEQAENSLHHTLV